MERGFRAEFQICIYSLHAQRLTHCSFTMSTEVSSEGIHVGLDPLSPGDVAECAIFVASGLVCPFHTQLTRYPWMNRDTPDLLTIDAGEGWRSTGQL